MQPNGRIGADVLVVPMTTRWNKNFMPMDANGETATPNQWFEGGSVEYMLQRPTVGTQETDSTPQTVKPRVLNPLDFLKGGTLF